MDEENNLITDKPVLDVNLNLPEKKKKKRVPLKEWWSTHKPTKRRLIQVYVALLTNANIKGFISGRIYNGATKNLCTPGLNCYSCPGAVASCPLGALQNAFAQSGTRAPYYIFGIIMLWGLIFARTVCGFLCPVGLGQELLYKIKTPKLKKSRVTRVLSYFKYVLLAVFVVAIPIIYGVFAQTAIPAFCKYICPAGTFGGAVGLLANPNNADMYYMLGELFTWKFALLVAVVVACIFIYRFFCRFLCPLGALYGFFNKYALLGVKLDKNSCTDCGLCVAHCKMDIRKVGDHECINCGECISVCPAKAISWKGSNLFVHKNAIDTPAPEEKPLGNLLSIGNNDGENTVEIELSHSETRNIQLASAYASAAPSSSSYVAFAEGSDTGATAAAQGSETAGNGSQKPVKTSRGKAFWAQVIAWCMALAVLLGAIVYYNFLHKDVVGGNQNVVGGNQVGDLCYDFTLKSYNGKEDFTLSEHRGKIVVINFWGTWCGPCVTELPEFQQLTEEFSEDVEVVAIHSAYQPQDVQSFLNTQADVYDTSRTWSQWDVTFVQDTGDDTHSATYDMLVGASDTYPVTVVVDKEGYITFVRQGSVKYGTLSLQVRSILAAEQ